MQVSEKINQETVVRIKALVDPMSGYYVDAYGNKLSKCPKKILDKINEGEKACKRT